MPCAAPARGLSDTKWPWVDSIQNNPCGLPIVTRVAGVDVSGQNLCLFHYEQKFGQNAVPRGIDGATVDAATVFLLHGEQLVDSSPYVHAVTANGGARLSTAQSVFGGSSLYLPGNSGDFFSSPDSPDWAFGAGDFTLDLWVNWVNPTSPPTQALICQWGASGAFSWNLRLGSPSLNFYYSPDGTTFPVFSFPFAPVAATWYHVALVRSGNNCMCFINGTQVGTTQTLSVTLFDSSAALGIGASAQAGATPLNGYIDEIRVSKGIARWTSNFAPPTAPYTTV